MALTTCPSRLFHTVYSLNTCHILLFGQLGTHHGLFGVWATLDFKKLCSVLSFHSFPGSLLGVRDGSFLQSVCPRMFLSWSITASQSTESLKLTLNILENISLCCTQTGLKPRAHTDTHQKDTKHHHDLPTWRDPRCFPCTWIYFAWHKESWITQAMCLVSWRPCVHLGSQSDLIRNIKQPRGLRIWCPGSKHSCSANVRWKPLNPCFSGMFTARTLCPCLLQLSLDPIWKKLESYPDLYPSLPNTVQQTYNITLLFVLHLKPCVFSFQSI